jgi:hypothetical protein
LSYKKKHTKALSKTYSGTNCITCDLNVTPFVSSLIQWAVMEELCAKPCVRLWESKDNSAQSCPQEAHRVERQTIYG